MTTYILAKAVLPGWDFRPNFSINGLFNHDLAYHASTPMRFAVVSVGSRRRTSKGGFKRFAGTEGKTFVGELFSQRRIGRFLGIEDHIMGR